MKTLSKILLLLLLSLPLAAQSTEAPKDPKARQAKAFALYKQHCETAGEKIYKTVDNVEGLFLMKVRPDKINFSDQFAMDDPYGNDSGGDRYIMSFLFGKKDTEHFDNKSTQGGFRYVDAIDPKDGQRYRYTGYIDQPWLRDKSYGEWVRRFALKKMPAPDKPTSRYGVTYDDISTREDREYWIAGSSLRVIDLQTNEVIAERIGYMIDWAQGSKAGGRSPWLLARNNACPRFYSTSGGDIPARRFVEKVLRPIQ